MEKEAVLAAKSGRIVTGKIRTHEIDLQIFFGESEENESAVLGP